MASTAPVIVPQDSERKRKHHKKGRGGCGTCKLSHVKCDEEAPECGRCRRLKLSCPGYHPLPLVPVRRYNRGAFHGFKNTLYLGPDTGSARDLQPIEKQAFEYFRLRTIYVLDGMDIPGLWTRLLLQVPEQIPAVKHLCTALGAYHRSMACADSDSDANLSSQEAAETRTLALKQYTKALSEVRRQTATQTSSDLIIILTCVLCAIIESLRGNISEMATHLQCGSRILDQLHGSTTVFYSEESKQVKSLLDTLGFIFFIYLHPPSDDYHEMQRAILQETSLQVPEPLNFADAIMGFKKFTHIAVSVSLKMNPRPDADVHMTRVIVGRHINRWLDTMALERERNSVWVKTHAASYNVMIASLNTSYISMMAYVKGEHKHFDAYLPRFRSIVDLLEPVFGQSRSIPFHETEERGFSIDLGVITVLFCVAKQCRDCVLRRRAVGLLKRVPQQEGPWNAGTAVKVANAIIEFEERGLTEEQLKDPFTHITESKRIINVDHLKSKLDTDSKEKYVVLNYRPRGEIEEIMVHL